MAVELFSGSLYNDSSLQSYYRFEADSTDSKALNNGTDTAMTYNAPSGKFANGASFNGTTSRVSIGSSKFNHTALSIVFWLTNKGTDKTDYIIARCPDADQWAYLGIGFESSRMFVACGEAGITVQTYAAVTSGDHYAFCFNGTEDKIYKNGALLTTKTHAAAPNNNIANELAFGRAGAFNNYYFDGAIDDLAFFSKQLSADEVKYLYDNTPIPVTPTTDNYSFFI